MIKYYTASPQPPGSNTALTPAPGTAESQQDNKQAEAASKDKPDEEAEKSISLLFFLRL